MLTFDRAASRFRLYTNGVLIAVENQHQKLASEPCGPHLYCGNPIVALADVQCFDRELSAAEVESLYRDRHDRVDEPLVRELRQTYAGAPRDTEEPDRGEGWTPALRLSLTEPADLDRLYVQGATDAVRMTPEGLRIDTPDRPPGWKAAVKGEDPHQLYLMDPRSL